MRNYKLIGAFGVLVVAASTVFACSDDSSSTSNTQNPFVPVDASASTTTGDSGANQDTTTDGGCPNKPVGCFCGTPTTQAQWLNRCTTATALPVNLTVPAATTANIP